ncbi:MAG: dihydroneopterin aldolase [Congregibacter sp.]
MSDRVFIRALRLPTIIGVYDWEREVRQELLVDVEMAWDMRPAVRSDEVADALNYAAVAERLRAFAAENSFRLIEKMAAELADLLLREFRVEWLRLELSKPGAVAEADTVGVAIERGQLPATSAKASE